MSSESKNEEEEEEEFTDEQILQNERKRIKKEIKLLQDQLTTDQNDELSLKLNIACLKLKINGYEIDYENATPERKATLEQLIGTKESLLQAHVARLPPLQIQSSTGDNNLLVQEMQSMRLTQYQILSQLPASIVHIKLTPSLDTTVKDTRFPKLMGALALDLPTITKGITTDEGIFANFNFPWIWDHKKENESYEPFCEAYCNSKLSGVAVCVSNGQRLPNQNLFTTALWSLRKFDAHGDKIGDVMYRGEVSGRTDLVLMKYDPGADLLRHNVNVAIEVKQKDDISTPAKLKSALREATTQLLGLCGDNSINTPPVILTDFYSVFLVLQLVLKSRYPLKFGIKTWNCSNIKSTLHTALTIANLPCISADFGRPDTPSGSDGDPGEIAGLKDADDDDFEDDDDKLS